MKAQEIIVLPHDPEWLEIFQDLKRVYEAQLADWTFDIEHVGSTAVPGLWAKPVLDIDLIVEDFSDLNEFVFALGQMGYTHRGNLGIPDREAFSRTSDSVPFSEKEEKWMEHHLYICRKGSDALNNHLILRDHLLRNDEDRSAYSSLKRKLVIEYRNESALYTENKTAFILGVLVQYGFSAKARAEIKKVNLASNCIESKPDSANENKGEK